MGALLQLAHSAQIRKRRSHSIYPLAEVTCYSTALTAIGHAKYRHRLYRVGRDKARQSEFYHLSPYAYCAGDPVNLVDPDGRLFGDFVDNKGRIIGNDGINDGKVYILKVSKDEIFENSINGSEYSLEELQNAKTFVEDYSGNADVFSMQPDVYNYFVETVGDMEF